VKNKIKYEMFLNRKKFNVINWIKTNGKDYQSFCAFLESRNVISPGEEYFDRALDFYDKNFLKTEKVEKEINVVSLQNKNDVQTKSKTEAINLAKKILELKELSENKEPVKPQLKEEPVKKTRRRRKTKKT
jgi:hypothetical protein